MSHIIEISWYCTIKINIKKGLRIKKIKKRLCRAMRKPCSVLRYDECLHDTLLIIRIILYGSISV